MIISQYTHKLVYITCINILTYIHTYGLYSICTLLNMINIMQFKNAHFINFHFEFYILLIITIKANLKNK